LVGRGREGNIGVKGRGLKDTGKGEEENVPEHQAKRLQNLSNSTSGEVVGGAGGGEEELGKGTGHLRKSKKKGGGRLFFRKESGGKMGGVRPGGI